MSHQYTPQFGFWVLLCVVLPAARTAHRPPPCRERELRGTRNKAVFPSKLFIILINNLVGPNAVCGPHLWVMGQQPGGAVIADRFNQNHVKTISRVSTRGPGQGLQGLAPRGAWLGLQALRPGTSTRVLSTNTDGRPPRCGAAAR